MRKLFALLVLLAGCKRERAPAPAPDAGVPAVAALEPPQNVAEVEPNDFQHPQQIPMRAIVHGTLSAPRDDDFFRVAPGTGRTVALRIELAQADAVLEVLDQDRAREVRVHGRLIPAVACRESCFVHLSGKGPQPYDLTVLAEEPRADRELEPDDRAEDAQALAPGVALQGSFLSGEDQDWYRLALPAASGSGQFLRVEVDSPARPELEVRAPGDSALLAAFHAQAAGEGLFVRDLSLDLGAGDAGVDGGPSAYLFVLKPSGRTPEAAPYTLTASLEAGPPDLETEPNDDPPHATALVDSASGYLSPKGDQDWYRVRAAAPSVLQAQVSGLSEDVELALFDAKGGGKPRLLARAAEDGGTQILPSFAVAGDVYLRVRMRSAESDDRDHLYKLSASLSPDDGSLEREPNDTIATAQLLTLPISLRGLLWPRRDVDVFRFHVGEGHPPVTLSLDVPRGFELVLRLYELHGDRGEVIGSSAAPSPTLVSVPLKEGDYAVEVSSPRKDASATDAYQLHVSP